MKAKAAFLIIALMVLSATLPRLPLLAAKPEAPNGPWVDEVTIFVEGDRAKVVDMLSKGDMHIYPFDISDPDLFAKIKEDPNLDYKLGYGLYYELTFNPVGPEFNDGRLNPFSNPKIREAINYIIDRQYIVDEIMSGFAKSKILPLGSAFPNYVKLLDFIKALEAKYSYNFEKGKEIIFEEMKKMGAEYNEQEGLWYYKGKPVEVIFVIRIEDQRKQIGDYVSDQLGKLGFKVTRLYKRSGEAWLLWGISDPAEGKWSIYTGGWVNTGIDRDESDVFATFYTSLSPFAGLPLWDSYKPDPLFYEVAKKLYLRDYKSPEEKMELMKKAATLALKDSARVWLIDQMAPFALRSDVDAVADLAAGFGSPWWARTIRFKDKVGGTIKMGDRALFLEPYNPVQGSSWWYDAILLWAIEDTDFLPHPYSGIQVPVRVKSAEVYITKGAVEATSISDWLKLSYVDKVQVPADAMYSYDPENDKIITAGEAGAKVAKVKVVVNYGDVVGKVKFHDGSVMSLADWLLGFALTFARVDPKSPLYDESAVENFNAWRQNFVAEKIVSEHPLVIEYYINYTYIEAENIVDWAASYPAYPWHMVAIGIMAEEKGELAFTESKASKMGTERMNYIGGPSLQILAKMVDEGIQTGYIPFKGILGKYVTTDEAKARYSNLKKFYEEHGHFYVSDGLFYLDKVDVTARQAVLKAFRDYIDKADRWSAFAAPIHPQLKVKAPDTVVPGLEAKFEVSITAKGQPYPTHKVEVCKYIIFDSQGNIVKTGMVKAVKDGLFEITFTPEDTGKFTPGSYKIMVAALTADISLPSIDETTFAVIPQISYFKTLISEVQSSMQAKLGSVESGVSSLNTKVQDLEAKVASLSSMLNTLMGITVLSLIVAIVAIIIAFKKPSPKKE